MDDEDVILRVDADADHGAEHPVVRQRLRPHRVDLETRRLHGLPRGALQRGLSNAESDNARLRVCCQESDCVAASHAP